MKKNINIIIEFKRGLKAENKAAKIALNALILDIVLNGLNTLNDLKAAKSTPELLPNLEKYADTTIIKSSIFQGSLKYAPLLKRKPKPITFKHNSMVYKIKNTKSMFSNSSFKGSLLFSPGSSNAKTTEFAIITKRVISSKIKDFMIL